MKKLNSNQARTLLRYGIIVMCLLILSALIVYKMFSTTIINHNAWNERAEKTLNDTTVISPIRGSILACDGSILACNLELYDISMDLRHPKIMRQKQLNWASIDSLADSLDRYFPRRPNLTHHDSIEKYSWNTALKKAFEKGDYWGYSPDKIVEVEEKLPAEICPGEGEIIQISSYRY